MAETVNLECLRILAEEFNEEWNCKAWNYDIKCLEKIITGTQDSFEIGAICTIPGHIIGLKTQNNPCSEYLRPFVETLLTDDGKEALQKKEICLM